MKDKWKRYLRYAFYSMPVQLVLLHIKKHPFFLIFWLILYLSVLQFFGVNYGIPFLFLDPEYLGHVNYLSYLITGFAMGGFIMAWNISFYMLNSFRFEFLASRVNPFAQFTLNNILLPLGFTIVYIIELVRFQHIEGLIPTGKIIVNVLGLISGNLLMVLSTSILFGTYNMDIEVFISRWFDWIKSWKIVQRLRMNREFFKKEHRKQWQIEAYLKFPFNAELVRKTDFYDQKLVDRVLFLHHKSAILFQVISILILIALGKMMGNPYFRLPAGASIFLLFAVAIVFFTFVTYIFRGWRLLAVVITIIVLNFLTQYGWVVYKHQLYGLDYTAQKIPYDNDAVNNAVSKAMVNGDIQQTQIILDNWHKKIFRKYGEQKPKIIFINTAGGGLKATYWTFYLLQQLERETNYKLFDHTFLLTGASGGMIGAAYYRELYLRKKEHEPINLLDKEYLEDVGHDMLNAVGTSIVTNDIFYPWQTYEYRGFKYKKDRAFMFDMQLNENTHYILSKPLLNYKKPEQLGEIPMMVVGSTIINDQRFMLFSPQPISYLIKPYIHESKGYFDNLSTDAVEFMRFFENRGARNINFIDALRVNATYPYIMPAVYLPTDPETKALDAGIRENSGFTVSSRFYSVFNDWIDQNTSGVIFISIRVDNKLHDFHVKGKETYLSELFSPLGSIFNNFILLQDYNSDIGLAYLENSSNTDINVLNFNYDERMKRKRASMSWHLTTLEKNDIRNAFAQDKNVEMLKKLKDLLK